MVTVLPGTTIETTLSEKDTARRLIDAVFAPGGLMLSQVVALTGLEPYVVQNWVKRGFQAQILPHRHYQLAERQLAA